MLPGNTITPEAVFGILRRRIWLIVIPLAVVSAATALYARYLPDLYSADTVILVVPQKVPENFVRSTVSDSIQERLQTITPTILSRTRLERIITEFDLYPEERRLWPMEDVVGKMKRDIQFPDSRDNSFRIRYLGTDPKKVMQVANRLGSLFIDENMADRRVQAEGTNKFLESQLIDAKAKLVEQEKKLEIYKREHAGELPSQVSSNLQQAEAAQRGVRDARESINRDRDMRLELVKQLGDLQNPIVAEMPAPTSQPSGVDPTGTTQQQLAQAQAVVADLEARGYKAGHPDLDKAQRRVRDLTAQVAREAAAPTPDAPRVVSPGEIERRRRIADLQTRIAEIDRQMVREQAEATRLQAVADDAQRRADALPTRESELTELTRDYGTLQASYNQLLAKKQDSQIATNLEELNIGEQFKLLDPAQIPARPYSPNRLMLNSIGAAAGLAIGMLLIGFVEYRDRSFRTDEELTRMLGLPVLAVIPVMQSDADRRNERLRSLLTYAVLGSVVIACAGLFIFAVGR
jgi:polysaccharide chain length determinant protein (PEP-CTERM system associated)